uniref:hypothetical protein n=1 Tax=Enterocloster clostridioformis TaxID=1531 RepID=UPI0026EBB526|nr:hypothetical protein [Enterocloster clostridioformis]
MFEKKLLEDSLGNIKKYNLACPIDKLSDTAARIQIYPSVMLALPDAALNQAYEQTKQFLRQYKNSREENDE